MPAEVMRLEPLFSGGKCNHFCMGMRTEAFDNDIDACGDQFAAAVLEYGSAERSAGPVQHIEPGEFNDSQHASIVVRQGFRQCFDKFSYRGGKQEFGVAEVHSVFA